MKWLVSLSLLAPACGVSSGSPASAPPSGEGAAPTAAAPHRTAQSPALNDARAGGTPFVLDVRTPGEFQGGHIPGATNIPIDQLRNRVGELSGAKSGEVWVICEAGSRSLAASKLLSKEGFQVVDVEDGMRGWRGHGFPTE